MISYDKDIYYMKMAIVASARSKCQRWKFGVVIVSKEDTVIATGFNGKPRGSCNDGICYREGLESGSLAGIPCCIHSEINALLFTTPENRAGGSLYVTGIPCQYCALVIAQSGITRLVCMREHHNYQGLDKLGVYGFLDKIETKVLSTSQVANYNTTLEDKDGDLVDSKAKASRTKSHSVRGNKRRV